MSLQMFTIHLSFSVADQQISDSLKHISACSRAFGLPALSVASEGNDRRVTMFNKVSQLVHFVLFMYLCIIISTSHVSL